MGNKDLPAYELNGSQTSIRRTIQYPRKPNGVANNTDATSFSFVSSLSLLSFGELIEFCALENIHLPQGRIEN